MDFDQDNKLEKIKEFEDAIHVKRKEWTKTKLKEYEEDSKFREYLSKNFGVAFFYQNLDSFKITLKKKLNPTNEEQKIIDKAENNIRVFRLEEVYNQHKDSVYDLVQKSIVYNDDYIDTLFAEYEGTLFKNKEELVGLILGNYISDEELGKRPLAKLSRDIAEELGLI